MSQRTKAVGLHLHPEEYDVLLARAREARRTFGRWAREVLLYGKPSEQIQDDEARHLSTVRALTHFRDSAADEVRRWRAVADRFGLGFYASPEDLARYLEAHHAAPSQRDGQAA